MANETAKIDDNRKKTLLGVTNDANGELRKLLVDPITGRLKVSATISSIGVLTDKGDLYTRDATDDARLPVGTNGQVLTADSTADTGLKWAAAGGGMDPATYDPGSVEEQLVGLTAIQTLTNKTLTSPKINENVAVTATATEINLLDGIVTLSGANTGDQDAGDFNHDDLANISGTTGEYNHPTDAQMVVIGNTSGTNSGDVVKATGAELDTATDDTKFATAKAIKDSHNVPSVTPSTSGNVLTSNGTDWISAAGSSGFDNTTVTYDTYGNVTTIVDTDASVTYTFTYTLGVVTSITDGTNTWTFTYTNDNITNIAKT